MCFKWCNKQETICIDLFHRKKAHCEPSWYLPAYKTPTFILTSSILHSGAGYLYPLLPVYFCWEIVYHGQVYLGSATNKIPMKLDKNVTERAVREEEIKDKIRKKVCFKVVYFNAEREKSEEIREEKGKESQ